MKHCELVPKLIASVDSSYLKCTPIKFTLNTIHVPIGDPLKVFLMKSADRIAHIFRLWHHERKLYDDSNQEGKQMGFGKCHIHSNRTLFHYVD